MDLQHGFFLNWPLGPYWDDNAELLALMLITWQTWRFCLNTAEATYQWTPADIHFDTWLNEDRPQLVILSEYEQWRLAQESLDTETDGGT